MTIRKRQDLAVFQQALTILIMLSVATFAAAEAEQPAADEKPTTEQILKEFEKKLKDVKTVKTDFIQKKELTVFERTMVIKGHMVVKNPDRMAWRVDEPVRYNLVIQGATLRQWDEDTDKVQKLKLDRDPAFQAVFEQLTVWFSGRYSSLLDKYSLEIEQTDPYILVFTPEEGTIFEKMIKRVRVVFREDAHYIKQLTIEEGSGDRTTIEFYNTRLNVPLADEKWEVRPQ